ncbi:MAG: ThuA domain-containing protein [Verrucomicrobiota bacterium]
MKNILILLLLVAAGSAVASDKIKVLIIDGQNNHAVWPKSTIMMKQYLEETGLFDVDVDRTKYIWKSFREQSYLPLAETGEAEAVQNPKTDPDFMPSFKDYDVVISNFGWKAAPWPKETQRAFEEFVGTGGGFVSVHAADNSFPGWEAYNEMIGIGGWGGRNEKDGPYVYYTNDGELVHDNSPGGAGAHGPVHKFPITIRDPYHPITQDMPTVWLTTNDECYAKLRGPAENMAVLATGKDQNENAPTDRHEPVLMALEFGEGRVFHTTLGHDTPAFEGVGFITTLLRGTEWAATGEVTIPIPDDFPTDTNAKRRPFKYKE